MQAHYLRNRQKNRSIRNGRNYNPMKRISGDLRHAMVASRRDLTDPYLDTAKGKAPISGGFPIGVSRPQIWSESLGTLANSSASLPVDGCGQVAAISCQSRVQRFSRKRVASIA
jgi:hypothetical protein